MTVFRKFEVCASYESSVVKSPPSPSRKTLAVIIVLKQSVVIASLIFLGCNTSDPDVTSTDSLNSDSNSISTIQQSEPKPIQPDVVAREQVAVSFDSLELIQFWNDCVEPIISLDKKQLKEIVHFPLDGEWGYILGLKNPKSNWSESDFFHGLHKLFYKEFRDSLDHQTYKDVHVYQQDDGEINLIIQVDFVETVDDFKYESSRILRYKIINDRWMLFAISEAG